MTKSFLFQTAILDNGSLNNVLISNLNFSKVAVQRICACVKRDVIRAREEHPNAKVLVHPECLAEVTELADFAGSTTEIMAYAKNSSEKEFIIGTESSIVQHLQFECPDKRFYLLSTECVCHNMKMTTLADIYNCLLGQAGRKNHPR